MFRSLDTVLDRLRQGVGEQNDNNGGGDDESENVDEMVNDKVIVDSEIDEGIPAVEEG